MRKAELKITVIPVIQFRTTMEYGDGGKTAWNEKYQKPGVAAAHWASHVVQDWIDRTYGSRSNLQPRDYQRIDERKAKYIRRSLPIFKAMLKQK
jgi:hypothetical protein